MFNFGRFSITAAFTWLRTTLCCLHSGIVVFKPLCWLPILPCRGPRSVMGFRRKPHRKCKTDFPIWWMIGCTHAYTSIFTMQLLQIMFWISALKSHSQALTVLF